MAAAPIATSSSLIAASIDASQVSSLIAASIDASQVNALTIACQKKHDQKGHFANKIISVAMAVNALWAGFAMGGIGGACLGLTLFFTGNLALTCLYDKIRNRDYLNAAEALDRFDFQVYLTERKVTLPIDTIIPIYKEFKQHVHSKY